MIIDMPTVSMGNSGIILPAEKVSYDNATSGLEAENLQDAVDELAWETFSFEETPIGTWVDGRTIFRKTVYFVTPATDSATNYVEDSPSNVDFIIARKGYCLHKNGTSKLALPMIDFATTPSGGGYLIANAFKVDIAVSNNKLVSYIKDTTGNTYTNQRGCAVVDYVKTS